MKISDLFTEFKLLFCYSKSLEFGFLSLLSLSLSLPLSPLVVYVIDIGKKAIWKDPFWGKRDKNQGKKERNWQIRRERGARGKIALF